MKSGESPSSMTVHTEQKMNDVKESAHFEVNGLGFEFLRNYDNSRDDADNKQDKRQHKREPILTYFN